MLFNDKLYYRYEKNINSNTLVVLLHGLTMSCSIEPINSLFNVLKEKYSVLTFDFIGHGNSYGKTQEITIKKELEDAKEIIDYYKNDYEKMILIGHSLGGVIANNLAKIYHPEKNILLGPAFNIYNDLLENIFFGKTVKENKILKIWDMKFSYDFFIDAKNKTYFDIYPNNTIIIHGRKDKIVPIDSIMVFKDEIEVITLNDDHEFTNDLQALIVTILNIL